MAEFRQVAQTVEPKKKERVKSVTVRLCAADCSGIIRITDIMMQPGGAKTGWVGNIGEIAFTLEG